MMETFSQHTFLQHTVLQDETVPQLQTTKYQASIDTH